MFGARLFFILAVIVGSASAYELGLFNGTTTEELVEYTIKRNLLQAEGRSVAETPAWRARFDPKQKKKYFSPSMTENICKGGPSKCNSNLGRYPYDSYERGPNGESILRIGYPKGAWSPGGGKSGGILFFAYPYKRDTITKDNPFSNQGATLEYDVKLDPNFECVKGGKLPGLAGGRSNGRGCGGGNDPAQCFSVRMMWRRQCNGELYIYAPRDKQTKGFCSKYRDCEEAEQYPCNFCNKDKGVSFARGVFKFVPGRWHNIKLSIVLNDPGKANGYVELRVDGRLVTSFDNMVWRQNRNVNVEAIDVASWFGGSDATWAPSRDTYSLIKNMRAYRTGSPTYSKLSGGRVAPLSEEDVTSETVTEYEDIYADITEEAYDDDF